VRAENGLNLNLHEVLEAVGKSDVLILGFLHLAPRILFDTRSGRDGPLFRLVPPVRTPEERFAHLRKLRPGLGDPERYVFIQWPLGLFSLMETGVWDKVVSHCQAAAGERALADCDGVLARIRQLDRKEDREAIVGDSYRTIWPSRRNRITGS
jgi:hypothetical protein